MQGDPLPLAQTVSFPNSTSFDSPRKARAKISHFPAARRTTSRNSSTVISFIAGREFATRQTSVPCLRSSRANGIIPRTTSAPLLSQNSSALRYLWKVPERLPALSDRPSVHDIFSLSLSKQSTAQGRAMEERAFL